MPTREPPTSLSAQNHSMLEMQEEFREYFGWDVSDDFNSAKQLLSTVEHTSIEKWERHYRLSAISKLYRRLVIRRPEITVIGAAVEPDEVTESLSRSALLVSADGSSGVFSELPPSLSEKAWSRLACVVSDADGGDGTLESAKRSIPFVLHAHGDNVDSWGDLIGFSEALPNPPELILTHQTPFDIQGMHNPGGFTDGDRAVCFLVALGVEIGQISTIGTRTDLVGRWSGSTDDEAKMEKLVWMGRFLEACGMKESDFK